MHQSQSLIPHRYVDCDGSLPSESLGMMIACTENSFSSFSSSSGLPLSRSSMLFRPGEVLVVCRIENFFFFGRMYCCNCVHKMFSLMTYCQLSTFYIDASVSVATRGQ